MSYWFCLSAEYDWLKSLVRGQVFSQRRICLPPTLEYLCSISGSSTGCSFPPRQTLGGKGDDSSNWVSATHLEHLHELLPPGSTQPWRVNHQLRALSLLTSQVKRINNIKKYWLQGPTLWCSGYTIALDSASHIGAVIWILAPQLLI